eukprot:TRINITY_DN2739_c0_g1_i1.p1 TRINITY_DN2739_c0_g1~~TRINITY_DN2739_c0_g1_i1.p1  ORF type:complete len:223 (-),score=71.16 TRINITY_DN2739_c0_g1_i1:291-959(-)
MSGNNNNEQIKKFAVVACGSFSPISIAHIGLFHEIQFLAEDKGLELVASYISPVSDAYGKKSLINIQHRINMINLALETEDIILDEWECTKDEYTPTVFVLQHIDEIVKQKHGNDVKTLFLCGADLLDSFNAPGIWAEEHTEIIARDFGFMVLLREGFSVDEIIAKNTYFTKYKENIITIEQEVFKDISSTKIRNRIKKGRTIRYLTPNPVIGYIAEHGLYQ